MPQPIDGRKASDYRQCMRNGHTFYDALMESVRHQCSLSLPFDRASAVMVSNAFALMVDGLVSICVRGAPRRDSRGPKGPPVIPLPPSRAIPGDSLGDSRR